MTLGVSLLGAIVALSTSSSASPATTDGQWLQRAVRVGENRYPVAIFVPATAAPSEGYPLLLFLHGSGERGSDGDAPTRSGLGPYVRAHAAEFPAISVFPQAPLDSDWSGAQADAALAAVDLVQRDFPVDPDRLYLTGMSRGEPRRVAVGHDAELLGELAHQRLRRALARLDLAAGEFPVAGVGLAFRTAAEQEAAVGLQDDGGRRFDDLPAHFPPCRPA